MVGAPAGAGLVENFPSIRFVMLRFPRGRLAGELPQRPQTTDAVGGTARPRDPVRHRCAARDLRSRGLRGSSLPPLIVAGGYERERSFGFIRRLGDPSPAMGTIVVSVEVALGWRAIDSPAAPPARVEAARDGWRTLLECLEEYDVPATWCVVGHLLHGDCDGVHEHHPLGPDRFAPERGVWESRRDLRLARGLVDETLASTPGHELGFLPFSHVEFGDEAVSTDLARAECAGYFEALPATMPNPRAAAFAGGTVGHRDVLAEWGFECYREPRPGGAVDGALARSARRLRDATVSGPPLVRPRLDEYGLVGLPTSLAPFDFDDPAGRLCKHTQARPVLRRIRRGLDRVATSEDGVLHCLLRPTDVATTADAVRLRDACSLIAERAGEDVDVATMTTVAERERTEATAAWVAPTR